MDIRERLNQSRRNRQAEFQADLVQTKTARKRVSRAVKIVNPDGCQDNPIRKRDGMARGFMLIDASHQVSTADVGAPSNNCKVLSRFQAQFPKYALEALTHLACYRFMVLSFHHPAPQLPVAQTVNSLP